MVPLPGELGTPAAVRPHRCGNRDRVVEVGQPAPLLDVQLDEVGGIEQDIVRLDEIRVQAGLPPGVRQTLSVPGDEPAGVVLAELARGQA